MNVFKLFLLFLFLLTGNFYAQTTIKHKVAKGESVYTIAKKYQVKEAEIYALNPEIEGKYLQLNAILLIPSLAIKNETPKNHTISAGETLNSIAQKYAIKLSKLIELNPNVDAKRLKIGTVLKLIADTEMKQQQNFNVELEEKHWVVAGETLGEIAQKYGISLVELERLNPDIEPNKLKIGTPLIVKKSATIISEKAAENFNNNLETTTKITEVKTHKIKKGETLKVIAKKYQLSIQQLQALNPKVEPRKLKIGTVLALNTIDTTQVVSTKDTSNVVFVDETKDVLHKVLEGETKYGIAKKYGITVEKIDELNPEVAKNLPVDYLLIIKEGTYNASLTPDIIEKAKFEEATSVKIEILIDEASKKIGTPYRSGGTSLKGFDCSGLMYTTFKEINMTLPRSSRGMASFGKKITNSEAKRGDLIFFTTNKRGTISHVGLITEIQGDEIKFIHSSTSLGVIISSTKEAYYAKRFVQINRVL